MQICPCGCGLETAKGRRFRRGHHWKALANNRFFSRVQKSSKCWLWTGAKTGEGYGSFSIGGRDIGAHVYSYGMHVGPITGLWVLHKCDTPACVRPDHLFLGTPRDNTQDAIQKTRFVPFDVGDDRPRGVGHGMVKLTEDDILTIRREYKRGSTTLTHLAKRFNITVANVSLIVNRVTWKHL